MNNASGVLYVGMTNHLQRRVKQHKEGTVEGFTKKYRINRLLFYEEFPSAIEAIAAEKQLKGWRREKKLAIVQEMNPELLDLAFDWYDDLKDNS